MRLCIGSSVSIRSWRTPYTPGSSPMYVRRITVFCSLSGTTCTCTGLFGTSALATLKLPFRAVRKMSRLPSCPGSTIGSTA